MYGCVYIYANPPLKPTVFNFLLCFTVIFVGFCRQKQPAFFSFIWRLWMLDHDESWCFMCRYNDIFWWYLQRFRLPYCVPNKGFQFKHWQNAHGTMAKCQFQALHCFLFTMFLFLLVTREILDFVCFQILQAYFLMINMVDISWAFFSLLCSFSVVVLMQWLNTLDVVWVLGGPRTS